MKMKRKQKLMLVLFSWGLFFFWLSLPAFADDDKKEVTGICFNEPSDALRFQKAFDAFSYDLQSLKWRLSQERNKKMEQRKQLEEDRSRFWIGMPNLRLKDTTHQPHIGISHAILVPNPPSKPETSPKKEIIKKSPPVVVYSE
jgi:hypothetical protein